MTDFQSEHSPNARTTLLRPADAARQLGIPASTLRRWSRRFASFLSPEANGVTKGDGIRGHRRYTTQDVAILARCKTLLSEGRTFEQVALALESDFRPDVVTVEGEVEMEAQPAAGESSQKEASFEMTPAEDAVDLGQMLAQVLTSLSGSQNMIITGQQTERELLGVLMQDNFNLKEENKKLRERMVETERRIFEMKREVERNRKDEQERMRQMEAYLFQLQRQMDDLMRRQTAPIVAPAYQAVLPQPVVPAQTPVPTPRMQPEASPPQPTPEPASPPQSPPESAPPPASAAQEPTAAEPSQPAAQPAPKPKKRSFWDWLMGR